jgi:hypothetical protein
MRLKSVLKLVVLPLLVIVIGIVMSGVGSSMISDEESRAYSGADKPSLYELCDFEFSSGESSDDGSGSFSEYGDPECYQEYLQKEQAAIEEEKRGGVMRLARVLKWGGWAMGVGGFLWVSVGLVVIRRRLLGV